MFVTWVHEIFWNVVVDQEDLIWIQMADHHIVLLYIVVYVVVFVHYLESLNQLDANFIASCLAEETFWDLFTKHA